VEVTTSASELAVIASATCPNSTLVPEASNVESIRASIFCLINRERARNGLQPLSANGHLQSSAQGHSNEMINEDYFAHVGPNGLSVSDRMRAAGYIYSRNIGYDIGENIAWGTLSLATPQEILEAWMASPDHRSNILDSNYRQTGIGIVASVPASMGEGQPGAMYTQDFGVLITH
jgi:uncharacterized protein YkwD